MIRHNLVLLFCMCRYGQFPVISIYGESFRGIFRWIYQLTRRSEGSLLFFLIIDICFSLIKHDLPSPMDLYDWQMAAVLDFGYRTGQVPNPHIRTIMSKFEVVPDRYFTLHATTSIHRYKDKGTGSSSLPVQPLLSVSAPEANGCH